VSVVGAVLLGLGLGLAYVAQMVRWLRVLQREHYDPTSMRRFLARWSSPTVPRARRYEPARLKRPFSLSQAFVIALIVTIALRAYVALAIVAALYGLSCPWGLSLRGRSGPLTWTRRLRRVAIVATFIALVITAAGVATSAPFLGATIVVLLVPGLLDVTTRLLAPLEDRQARAFVAQAQRRLSVVHPLVVAITGSYGKTSTKNYLRQLLSSERAVVASPRSYNNRAGLSRAVNENLADGTQIFIAEMGTYGPGEIASLVSWCTPTVSVVTAIGPVHLERMKSLDVIDAAKFEITTPASDVVLNVDDPRLAAWVTRLESAGKRVWRAGSSDQARDVRVETLAARWRVTWANGDTAEMDAPVGVQPTNLACALGAALACGVEASVLERHLSEVAPAEHRLNVGQAPSGVEVIDDTFNANPASAEAAVRLLASRPVAGRRVVVTPGLVELGGEQYAENVRLASLVASVGAELVVVARTNALALRNGYGGPVQRFERREEAVAWVRSSLVAGDGVLYLNDLPDHYP